MSVRLFDDSIPPECAYCVYSRRDGDSVLRCSRDGGKPAEKPCRDYSYDPLRRVPRQEARLPEYSPDDFFVG